MTDAGKEPGTTKHQVFISYASENSNSTTSDRKMADQICSALESQDIRCWIAHRDNVGGISWVKGIMSALMKSKVMILVFSSNADESHWVNSEVHLALKEKITIIPFCIEDVPNHSTLKFMVGDIHWISAETPPLQKHLERLVDDVHAHLHLEKEPKDHKLQHVKHTNTTKEKIKDSVDMPEDVKKVISKANKVDKNKDGYWEAYYQDGIVMVYIPPGEFIMGQTEEEKKWLVDRVGEKDYNSSFKNETPLHKVYLEGYWLGKFEVTNAQYVTFPNDSGIDHKNGFQGKPCIDTDKESEYFHIKGTKGNYHVEQSDENHPVIQVNWYGAVEYCNWLSKKTGLKFKLPTEAQWEKAVRGDDRRKYPWGSQEPDESLANFGRNIGKTTPVGSYPLGASTYGLLDMVGNVWELCSDWYDAGYYKDSPPKDPPGPKSGIDRVMRGGSWYFNAPVIRCASRYHLGPSDRVSGLGFRLCQDNR